MKKVNDALKYVNEKVGLLNPGTLDEIKQGRKELVENDLLLRIDLGQTFGSSGAVVPLIDADTKKKPGISDFQGKEISEPQIIEAISFGYAAPADTVAIGGAGFNHNSGNIPGALQNSVLRIIQDGKEVRFPVSTLISQDVAKKTGDERRILEAFRLLNEKKEISIDLLMAGAVDATAGKHAHISVVLHGFALRAKN